MKSRAEVEIRCGLCLRIETVKVEVEYGVSTHLPAAGRVNETVGAAVRAGFKDLGWRDVTINFCELDLPTEELRNTPKESGLRPVNVQACPECLKSALKNFHSDVLFHLDKLRASTSKVGRDG